jgi:hypothetical protein
MNLPPAASRCLLFLGLSLFFVVEPSDLIKPFLEQTLWENLQGGKSIRFIGWSYADLWSSFRAWPFPMACPNTAASGWPTGASIPDVMLNYSGELSRRSVFLLTVDLKYGFKGSKYIKMLNVK